MCKNPPILYFIENIQNSVLVFYLKNVIVMMAEHVSSWTLQPEIQPKGQILNNCSLKMYHVHGICVVNVHIGIPKCCFAFEVFTLMLETFLLLK